jgi:hypothetical protein
MTIALPDAAKCAAREVPRNPLPPAMTMEPEFEVAVNDKVSFVVVMKFRREKENPTDGSAIPRMKNEILVLDPARQFIRGIA